MTRKNLRQTPEWREIENLYQQLSMRQSFSLVGETPVFEPALEQLDQELVQILEAVPPFFPARFHRGEYLLRTGRTAEGEEQIEKAFESMMEIVQDQDEFCNYLAHRIENLDKLLRYDLAERYLGKASQLFPEEPSFYDDMAYYMLQQPGVEIEAVLEIQRKALELDPGNEYYINNLGWTYLMSGDIPEAMNHFREALEFDPENEGAYMNLETAEYMEEFGMTYREYLLRPAERGQMEEFLDTGNFSDALEMCREINADRMEAFKIHHLEKGEIQPHQLLNLMHTLKLFMGSVEESFGQEIVLYENIDLFHRELRKMAYRFVEGSEYVDEHLLEDVFGALEKMAEFLGEVKLITVDQQKRFVELLEPTGTQFKQSIEEYYRISHDLDLSPKDKEQQINTLFGI
jgi:tetratricopeptide (TPR) repeat protein